MVEFQLEENITDNEAEKLMEDSSFGIDDDASVEDQLEIDRSEKTDLFTSRLMKYEVRF